MGNSRRSVLVRSYALAFAVVLSPAVLQQEVPCTRGNANLLSLELEVDGGPNLIVGFDPVVRNYDVSTSGSTATVRADALINSSIVNWVWRVEGVAIGGEEIGVDGGEVTLPISIPDGQSELQIAVRIPPSMGTATALYKINIERVPPVRYACTEAGIRQAISDGGGPHYFDCQVPTTVPTGSEIVINNDVILDGEGLLTLDGQNDHRVFVVGSGVTVELADLAVTGGAEPAGSGAGILNHGTLTLTRCVVSDNVAAGNGGGVSSSGSLTLWSSTVSGNSAGSGGGGGGVFTDGSSLTVHNTTISDNSAGWGGGIHQLSGATTIVNSTLSGNTATTFSGGGIANQALIPGTSDLTVRNSTISGNTAHAHGDGIYNADASGTASLTLVNVTVSANAGSTSGSSIYDQGSLGSLVFETSLIDGECLIVDVTPAAQFTMESPGDTCGLSPTGSGNQVNVSALALVLGPLQDNGGPTWTHAPLGGSAAIDQIPTVYCMATDQRGIDRPQGTDCDFGAIEVTIAGSVFPCSEEGIRDAIAAGIGPYLFDCGVPTTVTTTAEIVIEKDVILDGEGLLTVDGDDDHRVFSVTSGVTAELHGMTITRGATSEHIGGGGILNLGALMLTNVVVSNNNTLISGSGGGITSSNALTLTDSVVSGNTAYAFGGGIDTGGSSSNLTLVRSTVSANVALTDGGGGINHGTGQLTLIDSAVSGNTAYLAGGGIWSNANPTVITRTTLSANRAAAAAGIRCSHLMSTDSVISDNIAEFDIGGIGAIGGDVTLIGTEVSRNRAELGLGGGIVVLESNTFTLEQGTVVSDNTAAGWAGGILNESEALVIDDSHVVRNTAGTRGGGLYNSRSIGGTSAWIQNNSTVSNNIAADAGGIHNSEVTMLTVSNSTVSGNSATNDGGGFYNKRTATLFVDGSDISGNEALANGGGIRNEGYVTITNSTVSGNRTTLNMSDSGGGGIFNASTGTASLDSSTVTTNSTAREGGGILNWGDLTAVRSTVSNNSASYGGGIYASGLQQATLTDSTVSGNFATFEGGGISARGGSTTLTNITVSGNHAGNFGGGLFDFAAVSIWNSTFANNTTGQFGSAIYGDVDQIGGTVLLGTASSQSFQHTCGGLLVSAGYNIESPDNTCGFNQGTDLVNVTTEDLKLGPLADNGGPTMTHALLPGSVALDTIPEVDCQVTEDQRGEPRPETGGTMCDVGAFEVQP